MTCRSLGHSWHHRPAQSDANSTLARLESQCTECTTLRTRFVTRRGLVYGRPRYEYPDGYKTRGEEKHTISEWRNMLVANLFE